MTPGLLAAPLWSGVDSMGLPWQVEDWQEVYITDVLILWFKLIIICNTDRLQILFFDICGLVP